MQGREHTGSVEGRTAVLSFLHDRRLSPATAEQPHRIGGLLSIDHIAVAEDAVVKDVERIVAAHEGRRLSAHDGYVVTVV